MRKGVGVFAPEPNMYTPHTRAAARSAAHTKTECTLTVCVHGHLAKLVLDDGHVAPVGAFALTVPQDMVNQSALSTAQEASHNGAWHLGHGLRGQL